MAVHNVELRPGAGGQLARSAGTSCTLVKKGEQAERHEGGAERWPAALAQEAALPKSRIAWPAPLHPPTLPSLTPPPHPNPPMQATTGTAW